MPSPVPSVARSAVWNHIGKVADYVLMYAGSIIIARGLGIEVYGRYAALISAIHVLLALSSFGLEAALTRHVASFQESDARERTRYLARRGAGLRLLLFCGATLVAAAVAAWKGWLPQPLEPLVLMLVVGYGLTRALVLIAVTVLTARFRTGQVAAIAIIGRLVEVTGFLAGTHYGLTTPIVFGTFLLSGAVQVLLYMLWCHDIWFGRESAVPLRPVVLFAGVFWVNALVDYFLGRQGDIALLALIGADPSATSRYDVSYSLLQAGAMIATLGLSGVSLAALSRYPAGDGAARLPLYGVLVRVNSLLTIPVLGFLFVAAPDILALLYSGPFVSATPVLRILLALRVASRIFAGGENADLLLSMDRVRPLVVIGIIAALATVGLHMVLIPRLGAEGAAVASGCGALVANVLSFMFIRRLLGTALQWRSWITLTASTLIAGAVTMTVLPGANDVSGLVLKGVVFAGAWVLCGLVFHPVEESDSDALGRVLPIMRKPLTLLVVRRGRGA